VSELITMRQRISSIQTIKKITEAMRLISLSSQLKLKGSFKELEVYTKQVGLLLERIHAHNDRAQETSILNPEPGNKNLYIIIGSQKGLCGKFNTEILHALHEYLPDNNAEFIVAGKKLLEAIDNSLKMPIAISYANLETASLGLIAKNILEHISTKNPRYSTVTILSNKIVQGMFPIVKKNVIIPYAIETNKNTPSQDSSYYWPQEPGLLVQNIENSFLQSYIYEHFLSSLIAEHVARFTSMHRATQNASDLLSAMRLSYNKLRQAKITKELTDLSASL
jgi:F-type H+-transporting ATPase subunit gamma